MGKLIKSILFPKREGLKGADKPIVIVVHSPYDTDDHSIDFSSTKETVQESGYRMLSKGRLTYDELDRDAFAKAIRDVRSSSHKQLTVWLESHGATGWLFGRKQDSEHEFESTIKFVKFIHELEIYTGFSVNQIVLSGCFTANEIVNPDDMTYMVSPARILSILLPDTRILGFVGQNACAKVTNVFYKNKDDVFTTQVVALEDAAVLFQNGQVIESYHDNGKRPLYCSHKYTPRFVLEHCKLEIAGAEKKSTYFEPCLAPEKIDRERLHIDPTCYGQMQLELAKKACAELNERPAPYPREGKPTI